MFIEFYFFLSSKCGSECDCWVEMLASGEGFVHPSKLLNDELSVGEVP
jgi:hypothetical protein